MSSMLALGITLLSGCEDSEGLVARVDQAPISFAEVDFLLTKRGLAPQTATPAQRAKAEDELIDQAVFVQQARQLSLDQDPAYIHASKDLLAKAYMGHLANTIGEPEPDEIKAYYDAHPELFRERRRYHLQEIGIQADGEKLVAAQRHFEKIQTFNEFVVWLKENQIPYKVAATIKRSDEVPGDVLLHLRSAHEGQAFNVRIAGGMAALQIARIAPDPVTLEQAQRDISKYLRNRKIEFVVTKAAEDLRSKAKIERYEANVRSNVTR